MKRIVLLLVLSAVVCHAQSLDQSLVSLNAQMVSLTSQLRRLNRNLDIRNQIDHEFVEMVLELRALQDERVETICQKHIDKITALSEKLHQK